MSNSEQLVKKNAALSALKTFHAGKEEGRIVVSRLTEILGKIPEYNIEVLTVEITEKNILRLTISHHHDKFRIIQVLVSENIIGITACMMKDTLNRQWEEGKKFSKIDDLAHVYFEAIFGDAFEKELVHSGNELYECTLCFDDPRLINRTYITKRNKWKKRFFGIRKKKAQRFRYLSFFKDYDYYVKNEFLSEEN